ncbi:MAG: type II 3-dehydroquinate dehydratase, partial [Clostridia bacterium]
AVILNAGAFTHYSYAIRDALTDYGKRVVEVHLSDIMSREDFRKISVFDGVAVAKFYGEKQNSYYKAIDFLVTE